jgi:anti-sigma regulatory factor (Ser/Thr protein kinase)
VNGRSLLLKMELRSNPETLCVVRGALSQLAETLGFSESECRAVVLGVDEALTNIIRHAYAGQSEQPIEVWFHRIQVPSRGANTEALEIVLLDQGKKVDEAKLCGRALEDVRPGGLGLHFIRETMDEVEFSHANGRNQLRLVKIIHAQGTPTGS